MKLFNTVFGGPPEAVATAPGRVNLLGEHTDYNGGFVLPIAIAQQTCVAMRRNAQAHFVLHAADLSRTFRFTLAETAVEHFASYIFGCLKLVQSHGVVVAPLDIYVSSDVPMGVGLSSSAALEVATLRCLRRLLDLSFDDVLIAQLAQQAEIVYAGVHCGIMDQMASSLATTDCALFLDTRTLERRSVPIPAGSAVLVLDSGVARSLSASGYNDRRRECEEAAKLLGKPALRDVVQLEDLAVLPETLRRRARHVVTENARVLQASTGVTTAADFGQLMNASHASLRDDFEVSTDALDHLVGLLQAHPAVYGARLTGAGFGGACVALCRSEAIPELAKSVLAQYQSAGHCGKQLVPALALD